MGRQGGRKGWAKLFGGDGAHSFGTDVSAARRGDEGGCVGDGCSFVETLEVVVADLPLFEREVYWLAARDGLGDEVIGERLGLSGREVRRYLAAALVRIADALDGQGRG